MINLIRLLRLNNSIYFFLAAVVLIGCSKKETRPEYVARVNNAYLTSDELASLVDTSVSGFYREEIIRKWINLELLYQIAVKEGITEEKEFKNKIKNSEKELAASILLNRYYDNEEIGVSPGEIEEYYKNNSSEFMISSPAYLINLITFDKEEKALQFRNTTIESDWEKSILLFEGDSSIIQNEIRKFIYEYEVHPVSLLRIIKELYPAEISIILNNEKGNYYMVQLIEKYSAGTIPPLDVIKSSVEKRLLSNKKDKLIRNFIKELYSSNDIEVKN